MNKFVIVVLVGIGLGLLYLFFFKASPFIRKIVLFIGLISISIYFLIRGLGYIINNGERY